MTQHNCTNLNNSIFFWQYLDIPVRIDHSAEYGWPTGLSLPPSIALQLRFIFLRSYILVLLITHTDSIFCLVKSYYLPKCAFCACTRNPTEINIVNLPIHYILPLAPHQFTSKSYSEQQIFLLIVVSLVKSNE